MKIALDWDGTFTRDIPFWLSFVAKAKRCGHEVRIVTMRGPDQIGDILGILNDDTIPVVTTNMHQKREFCDKLGWHPDIWIDDSPEFIVRRDFDTFLKAIDEIN